MKISKGLVEKTLKFLTGLSKDASAPEVAKVRELTTQLSKALSGSEKKSIGEGITRTTGRKKLKLSSKSEEVVAAKKRGRPKGSKNKPKVETKETTTIKASTSTNTITEDKVKSFVPKNYKYISHKEDATGQNILLTCKRAPRGRAAAKMSLEDNGLMTLTIPKRKITGAPTVQTTASNNKQAAEMIAPRTQVQPMMPFTTNPMAMPVNKTPRRISIKMPPMMAQTAGGESKVATISLNGQKVKVNLPKGYKATDEIYQFEDHIEVICEEVQKGRPARDAIKNKVTVSIPKGDITPVKARKITRDISKLIPQAEKPIDLTKLEELTTEDILVGFDKLLKNPNIEKAIFEDPELFEIMCNAQASKDREIMTSALRMLSNCSKDEMACKTALSKFKATHLTKATQNKASEVLGKHFNLDNPVENSLAKKVEQLCAKEIAKGEYKEIEALSNVCKQYLNTPKDKQSQIMEVKKIFDSAIEANPKLKSKISSLFNWYKREVYINVDTTIPCYTLKKGPNGEEVVSRLYKDITIPAKTKKDVLEKDESLLEKFEEAMHYIIPAKGRSGVKICRINEKYRANLKLVDSKFRIGSYDGETFTHFYEKKTNRR